MAMIEYSWRTRIPDTVAAYLSSGSEPRPLQMVSGSGLRPRVLLPMLSHPIGGHLDKPA